MPRERVQRRIDALSAWAREVVAAVRDSRPEHSGRIGAPMIAFALSASIFILGVAGCTGKTGVKPTVTMEPPSPQATVVESPPMATTATSDKSIPEPTQAIAQELPLDFKIALYTGQELLNATELRLSEVLAQGKPVVLNFWAGLCIPCRAEMSSLQEIYEEYGAEVLIVGVDVGAFTRFGQKKDALELMSKVGTTYPTGTIETGDVLIEYQVTGIPFTYFIKPDGTTLLTWNGFMNSGTVRDLVQRLRFASIQ